MISKIKEFLKEEDGVTMVEYALMLALIAIVCITVVTNLGTNTNAVFEEARNALADALN